MGKGLMAYWAKLASRAAFRKGEAKYCGHINAVTSGMWAGGIVGLKSILGVKSRSAALEVLNQLGSMGYIKYGIDPKTRKLTYEIKDWVVKCSGAECLTGTVYATDGYGFLCLPSSYGCLIFNMQYPSGTLNTLPPTGRNYEYSERNTHKWQLYLHGKL